MKRPWIHYFLVCILLFLFSLILIHGIRTGDMNAARIESSTL